MSDDTVLREISETLRNERGYGPPELGPLCAIWRKEDDDDKGTYQRGMSVGEFLSDPANQSGTWLIDGGWGGPPGPIHVRWNGTYWDNGGFCGYRFRKQGSTV